MKEIKKESFYKTEHEKMLKKVVTNFYNYFIGTHENGYLDGSEYHAFTEDELIETIVNEILTAKDCLEIEDSWEVLEAKHVRFMGKQRVHEIVEHRVKFMHKEDGKWMWEK